MSHLLMRRRWGLKLVLEPSWSCSGFNFKVPFKILKIYSLLGSKCTCAGTGSTCGQFLFSQRNVQAKWLSWVELPVFTHSCLLLALCLSFFPPLYKFGRGSGAPSWSPPSLLLSAPDGGQFLVSVSPLHYKGGVF